MKQASENVRLLGPRMARSAGLSLIALVLLSALCCSPAVAQQLDYVPDVNDMSTSPIGPTSPLGIDSTSSVGAAGIPLGATEIRSAGLSPLAAYSSGTIALPGSNPTCATSGASNNYDGGGMAMGSAAAATAPTVGSTAMTGIATSSGSPQSAGISAPSAPPTEPGTLPATGMSTSAALGTVGVSGMCGAGSSGPPMSPSSPTATTPTTPGGNPRIGIPLDSWEIANLGVSSSAPIPTPAISPFASTVGPSVPSPTIPVMPVVTAPPPTSALPAPKILTPVTKRPFGLHCTGGPTTMIPCSP